MEGAKLAAMRTQPQVCVEVEHVDDLSNWRSGIAWGIFAECGDQNPAGPHRGTVYRIRPETKTGRFEKVDAARQSL